MNLINLKQNRTTKARAEKLTRTNNRDWYSIKNATQDRAEVFIFDEIGWWGVTAQNFIKDFKEITAKDIDLRINSPGGAVFEGMAIFNAIKRHPSNVVVHVEALAASIASVIALAGNEVNIAKNAHVMIHKAFTVSIGNADDLRKEAEILDRIDDSIAEIYAERLDEHKGDILNLMDAETWFNADEALEIGLADTIEGESAAENSFDLTIFNHAPKELLELTKKQRDENKLNPKNVERALRDAGYSKREAQAALAGCRGNDDLRDADRRMTEIANDIIRNLKN